MGNWLYEMKLDGYRALTFRAGSEVRLLSRNGKDNTLRFANIAAAIARLRPATLLLD